MSKFSERLQAALDIRGMKQIELSELSGVSRANISAYLSDKYTAKNDKLTFLAAALGTTEEWLLGEDIPFPKNAVDSVQNQTLKIATNAQIVSLIKAVMDEKHISPSEFSRRTGIPKSSVSRYLEQSRTIPLDRIEMIAKALEISVADLLSANYEYTEADTEEATSSDTNTFSRIKALANDKGKSIRKVERELGFPTSSLYKWKKFGASGPKLQKVANYFGVTTDYLLGREDGKAIIQPIEMTDKSVPLLLNGKQLNDNQRQVIVALAQAYLDNQAEVD
jgi:transcriptional regulator with XRE-family HTH domain